ncbi:DUF4344 domain-containing metallopeptidase [Hoeflea poritis]|uniref:DUF4344 domain-containing metallopeptidase n=1 Tax=Hoeflea poritis TaxID=2993659 RepID=A0ABT4VM44_9HYPH|nr:DUF4344 domain-containing metallopeptidase [Hoeflea poritis]MDA4845182.1 DUF4344 domain-containing metallopeptidase [Hoeflea poritis]
MRTLSFGAFACATLLGSCPALSEMSEQQYDFVQANMIGVFYHEMGHAIIDTEEVPIFGQEEDAADVLSALLIHETFLEEDAQSIAFDAAYGYINDPSGMEAVAYWDNHGPDEQRFYNHVCIFFGAAPDKRRALAEDLGLPEERADWCPAEYEQASEAWGTVLDEMAKRPQKDTLVFIPGTGWHADVLNEIVATEVEDFNANFTLSHPVQVRVEPCGQANAFYQADGRILTMCTEFIDHMLELEKRY